MSKAKGPGGRPKVFSEEDLQKLGKKLLAWCRENGNWHISGFEDDNDLAVEWASNMARSRPEEFARTYKRAKAILGRKMMSLVMEKSGPSPWMQATILPLYLEDIDAHIDTKIEKKIALEEKAKRVERDSISDAASAIIGAANLLSGGSKGEKTTKPETD